jgi:hypothetical protein
LDHEAKSRLGILQFEASAIKDVQPSRLDAVIDAETDVIARKLHWPNAPESDY